MLSSVGDAARPVLRQAAHGDGGSVIAASHPDRGERFFSADAATALLFTENETNTERLFGTANPTPYVKDGINNYIVDGGINAANAEKKGTKVAGSESETPRKVPGNLPAFVASCSVRRSIRNHGVRHGSGTAAPKLKSSKRPWQCLNMATLRDVPIQPLDIILFHGIDPVSHAICFFEAKKFGHGDFSHAGVAITREVLDLPFLEPGKIYVWESTLSAPAGFWAHLTDKVPDAETKGLRFGVQIRDLELVIPGYSVGGGKVAWCAFRGERPPIEETRKHLLALHEEYGHAPYTANLLAVFAVVFPALRTMRDRFDRAEDRLAHFMNHVLERARTHKRLVDAEHHVFCSEWAGIVYKRLGLAARPDFDPRLAAPVRPLEWPDRFAEPVLLEPEDPAAQKS